jgi:hypothetical protein
VGSFWDGPFRLFSRDPEIDVRPGDAPFRVSFAVGGNRVRVATGSFPTEKHGTVPVTACQIPIVVPIPSFACASIGEKWRSTVDLAVSGVAGDSPLAWPM